MVIVRRMFLITAIRALQAVERFLDVLFLSKPYIPFGIASLVIGFILGFILIR
jgi:hypothetical protein